MRLVLLQIFHLNLGSLLSPIYSSVFEFMCTFLAQESDAKSNLIVDSLEAVFNLRLVAYVIKPLKPKRKTLVILFKVKQTA